MSPKGAHRQSRRREEEEASARESRSLRPEEIEVLLLEGEIEGIDLIPHGSNYTFAVRLHLDDFRFFGIYKPASGERPLWDFPYGTLHKRERSAFLVSRALGWGFVPPTVIRDGPHGEGSVQLYISHDASSNYFTLREEGRHELLLVAAFDLMVNNTDRKGGHCLKGKDERVWVIDHGLTFHVDPKLRTVIWDYSGQTLPSETLEDIERLGRTLADGESPLRRELDDLLDAEEVDIFRRRVQAVLKGPRLPHPEEYRSFPWPPV